MTPVTHPRGPLPARVYWTRRLLLVVVAFGLVFGIAHLLGSGGGGAGPSAQPVGADASTTDPPAPTPTAATPSVRAPTYPPEQVTVSPTGKAKQGATPTPLATPSGECENSDVVATPAVKGKAYAGRAIVFAVTLTTKVSPACTWTVSAQSLVLKVTSGPDRIWSTQQCVGAVPKQSVVVRKDAPTIVDVAWNGQRSDDSCTRSTAWAEPGYYHAVAAAFGADPTDAQFKLLSPVRATVTATPTPDAKNKKDARTSKATATASPNAKATATAKAKGKARASAAPTRTPKRHTSRSPRP